VDGAQVAGGAATLPEAQAEVRIGEGLVGLMDEVQVASAARPAEWVKLAAGGQGAEARLLTVSAGDEAGGEEAGGSYFGILVGNLTTDAWVVIIILAVMFVVACAVMVAKARLIGITDQDNRSFLRRFREASHDFLELGEGAVHPHSSLFRLYQAGIREVMKRADARGEVSLSGAAIDAIKAAVDADLVRETHKLNAKMVLLTIAISGGPFLGLLGTVVGVMITFAAIAAAGDVNVNAIAPGIAAALLATVAGLAVAIPALFGYNYLASRIKNISADMQIFVDEFITRVAERHSA
jgi:biopolymer transport protein ExbB